MEQFLPLLILALISLFFNRAGKKKQKDQKGSGRHATQPVLTADRNKTFEEEQQKMKLEQQRRERERLRQLEQQRQAKMEQQRKPVMTNKAPRNLKEAAEILLQQTMANFEEKMPEAEIKIEQLKEREAAVREKAKAIAPNPVTKEELKIDRKPKVSNQWLVNEDDIVKGIIMAEVLGPPRAKRPYSRS